MKLLMMLVILSSCASGSKMALTKKGKEVEILKVKASEDCSMLGKVVGVSKEGSAELARNDARNMAGKLGATHLWIDHEVPNGQVIKIHASAYQCE